MSLNILVTGGAGFIGSHTCVALVEAGWKPLVLDNFSNSDESALERVAGITGYRPPVWRGDVRDADLLDNVFRSQPIHAVIHFAGLKSVEESVANPLRYYDWNVQGSLNLVAAMQRADVHRLIFSSSATVYGEPDASPVDETAALRPRNPYGRSKLVVEKVLSDLASTDERWRCALLRYFNPAGAHESGLLGEQAFGIPNNLVPILCQVASGERACLTVHGSDYATPDGTCIRDYVHVMDVAEGHVAALRYLDLHPGTHAFNLGLGRGMSVLELLQAFRAACGSPVAHRFGPRREGDAAACWADAGLAQRLLGWKARRSLADICADAWRWQMQGVRRMARA